jgi:iron complex outermembrane receptor protein
MNKKIIILSVCVATYLQSADLNKVVVEEKINTITVKNIGQEELKSADLAEALVKNVPSTSLVRRSGIANDIILRGQKRDNINIIVDGTKTCGACVNRMDPPTSHIANQIVENVEIKEGPFDVENMGTLSGLVNITTREPKSGFSGEANLNVGSFGYQKESLTLNGGNEDIKVLVTVAHEKGEQYEDGNGDTFAQQLKKSTDGTSSVGTQYQPRYEDMDAYEKTTFMAKIFGHIDENQDIKISYTGNRSDDVLYPSSKMDAIWDDSDIINLEYEIRNIAKYSKTLNFQIYNSQVDHPMSIRYRKKAVANNPMTNTPYGDLTNHLTTEMQGIKLKNSFNLSNTEVTVGLDTSTRNWDGTYYKAVNGAYMKFPMGPSKGEIKKSIDNGESVNKAIFLKTNTNIGSVTLESGLRFDDTEVTNNSTAPDTDYNSLSGNIFATIDAGNDMRYFVGVGKSTRVPDTRELYFMSSMSPDANTLIGNPNLDQTTNYEVDLGFEKIYDSFSIKTKMFYSILKDYIYLNASKKKNVFENIDAKIYGVEVSGSYLATDSLYFDYGVAYKKGEKDDPLAGQSDTDLAEISPLKANIGIGYDYDSTFSAKLDIVAASTWDNYDGDNGEQELDGYSVLNLKINKEFNNGIGITIGVDNILDETYTTTNTYKDLTLITTGAGVDDVMLLNEPGRYFYMNASYKF